MGFKEFTKRFSMNPLQATSDLLLSVGGLNWGYVALKGGNFVENLATVVNMPGLENFVYLLVGVAGLVSFWGLFQK